MSYTQSYSSSIKVSGSVNVHYPASEHGGSMTAYYNDTIPVNINIAVNTEPFDKSVDTANLSVDGLTASVAAMNAANCAAIAKYSDQISDSIIGGFYGLIQNDISTKKTETNTVIQTKSALLLEHSKAVTDKHARMQSDLERERAKYGMVFSELDRELERRVTELDKPAFRLSQKIRQDIVIKPYLSVAADTADRLGKGSSSGGNIAIAGLRQKISTVLHNLNESLRSNLHYRHLMRNALWNKSIDENRQLSYIPVAYCISEDLSAPQRVCKCYSPESTNKDSVLNAVDSYVNSNSGEERDIPEEEMNLIRQAFSNMLQDSYTSTADRSEFQKRVYSEIFRLWKADSPRFKQI